MKPPNGSWIETFELVRLRRAHCSCGPSSLARSTWCSSLPARTWPRCCFRVRRRGAAKSPSAFRLARRASAWYACWSRRACCWLRAAGGVSVWLLYHVPQPLFRYISPKRPHFPLPAGLAHLRICRRRSCCSTGIASGLAPALESVKVDLDRVAEGLKRNVGGGGGSKARAWLVTAQVAMSMVLLVEAALSVSPRSRNLNADPGYLSRHVVVAPLRFPDNISPRCRSCTPQPCRRSRACPSRCARRQLLR